MDELVRDYKIAAEIITSKVIQAAPGVVATTLKSIVAAEGTDIYRDVPKLAAQMKEKGVRDSTIKQIELVLYGTTFIRYLDQLNNGLSAIDINNIILSAESAGLTTKVARKIISDILFSLNVPQLAQEVSAEDLAEQAAGGIVYIPPAAYEGRLKDILRKAKNYQELTPDEFSDVNAFAQAGISGAYTVLGLVYMAGVGVPKDETVAKDHLKYAAAHGDAEAYGLLADYYYGKDNMKAFELYSRPGAMAMNEQRRTMFRNLHKVKRYNRMQALLIVALTLVIGVFMFLFNSSAITGEHMIACVVCSVINVLTLVGIGIVHFKNPYQDLRNFSLPLLITFFIYAQILV